MPEWVTRVPRLHVEIPRNLECPSRESTFVGTKEDEVSTARGEERGCQSVDASVIPSECVSVCGCVCVWVRVCSQQVKYDI
jgi:hypothetical protein